MNTHIINMIIWHGVLLHQLIKTCHNEWGFDRNMNNLKLFEMQHSCISKLEKTRFLISYIKPTQPARLSRWFCNKHGVLKIRTICHAHDMWKLARSCWQLHWLCPPDARNLPGTASLNGFQSSGELWNPLNKTVILFYMVYRICKHMTEMTCTLYL